MTEACRLLIARTPVRPLRIALVTETYPPEINGVAMTLGRMVEGLQSRGHFVELVRPRQRRNELPAHGATLGEVLTPGMGIPNYPGLHLGLPVKRRLLGLWRRVRPDIVHVATEGPLGWSAVAAARLLKLPVSSDFHTQFDHYSRHYGFAWLTWAVAAFLRRFHNKTDLTLVPTETLRLDLETRGFRRVAVLARGVDTRLFNPQRRSPELRAAWGLGERDLAVLHVGRLAAEKNLSLVLVAFDAMRTRHPAARLVFVGDGPERARLEKRRPDAIFCGMRTGEDLARHYASGDVFLFPSLSETFGNVTLEALASGLCVLAYRHAGAAELIRHHDNGLLALAGDEAAFVAQAQALASSAAGDLAAMGERAAQSVAGHDWERIHDAFAQELGDLVATANTDAKNDYLLATD